MSSTAPPTSRTTTTWSTPPSRAARKTSVRSALLSRSQPTICRRCTINCGSRWTPDGRNWPTSRARTEYRPLPMPRLSRVKSQRHSPTPASAATCNSRPKMPTRPRPKPSSRSNQQSRTRASPSLLSDFRGALVSFTLAETVPPSHRTHLTGGRLQMRQIIHVGILVVVLIVMAITPSVVRAQGAAAATVSLEDQLKAQYTLVKMGADSSGAAVIEQGTVLVVKKGGILGVPYSDQSIFATKYENGAVHSPNPLGQKALGFGLGKLGRSAPTTQFYQKDVKVYPSRIAVNLAKD